jgi:uncharacterized protein YkwD
MNPLKSVLILALFASTFSSCKDDSPPSVDPGSSDEAIREGYKNNITATHLVDFGWTGSTSTCTAGSISADAQAKTLQRINYFRDLAGLPSDITFNTVWNAQCHEAALMCHANSKLSHSPPSTWNCYSADGAAAAGRSNLSSSSSTNAMISYMRDHGSNNTAVGHRRYILSSRAKTMGHGATNRYDALWVIGGSENNPNPPEYIAWPPNVVPAPLVFPRWSFGIPDANFATSTVEMKEEGGLNVNVNVVSQSDNFGDPTIVFEPQGIDLTTNGKTYEVSVKGVVVGLDTKDFNYKVRIVTID